MKPELRLLKDLPVATKRRLRLLSLTSLLVVLVLVNSLCDHEQRAPKIDMEGEASWYKDSQEEKEYLLRVFPVAPVEGKKTIPWPPEELARYVDISIDVTESSFSYRMLYRGKEIPWAEYNVNKFADYLMNEHVLLPGDRVTLRIFGSNPTLKKDQKLSQDQSWDIINPPLQIEIEYQTYTARFNDRHLKIVKTSGNYGDYERQTVSQIQEWCLDKVRQQIYTRSPLLDHIATVKRNTDSKTVKRLLIFVTDGHIDFEDVYFSPTDYSDEVVNKIRNTVEELRLKPFPDPNPNVAVMLFGLNDGGKERFRQKQEALLRWFFSNQDQRLVTFVRN